MEPPTIAETTQILRRTPELLRTLLVGLPDTWTDTPDTPDGWRPRDVVGHLITGEQTDWLARTQRILEHGTSVPFDRFERFAHKGRDVGASLDELIERFAALRAQNLARFEDLAKDTDLDHIAQIFAGLAGSHDADVGPWKAYLGILLRREDPAAVPG